MGAGWTSVGGFDRHAVNQKVEPWPGVLSTPILPPIMCVSCLAMVNPKPVPPYLQVIDPSTYAKDSKIVVCISGAMPMPVSRTVKYNSVDGASGRGVGSRPVL